MVTTFRLPRIRYILFFVVIIVLTTSLLWLVTTRSGFLFTLNTAKTISGLSIEFENLQGTFTDDITADRLTYQDDTVNINIEGFSTRLNLFWLADALLAFDETRITRAVITLKNKRKENHDDQSIDLPLGFSLETTAINSLVITDAESSTPMIELSNIAAKDIYIKQTIAFKKLAFDFPNGQIKLKGKIALTSLLDLDLTARWQLSQTENTPAIAGESKIKGDILKITSTTQLKQPQTASINAVIENIASDLQWRASIKSSSIDLNMINASLKAKLEDTLAEVKGDKKSAQIELNTKMLDPVYGRWKSSVKAEIDSLQWKISALEMQSLDTPTQLNAHGNSTGDTPYSINTGFEITANWQNLQWPLTGNAEYVSDSGRGKLTGTYDNYNLKVGGKFSFDNYIFDGVDISGTGNVDNMQFSSVSTKYLNGLWQGNSSIDWSNGFHWKASLDVTNANPGLQWPELSAQLTGTVNGEGAHLKDNWSISGNIKKLSGVFRDYPVKGNSKFNVSNNEYSFTKIDLRSGSNSVAGNITISNYLSKADSQILANWNIDAKNLSQLLSDTSGTILSNGKMSGNMDTPTIDATLSAANVRYLNYAFKNVELDAKANLQENAKLQVIATIRDGSVSESTVEELIVAIKGTTHNHTVDINSRFPGGNSIHLKAESGFYNKSWDGKLTGLDIATEKYGEWNLPSPTPFQLSDQQWYIDNVCLALKAQPAKACLNILAKRETDSYRISNEIYNIPISLIQHLMPVYITQAVGVVNGVSSLVINSDRIKNFSLSLKSENAALTHNIINKSPDTINIKELSITGKHHNQDIVFSGNADLQQTGKAVIKFTLPKVGSLSDFNGSQSIEGMVNIALKDLSSLRAFIPEVQSIEGETSSDFRISGTLNNPELTGKSTLTAGVITLPQVGLELKNTTLKAQSLKSKALLFEGITHSGDGNIDIKGDIPNYNAENILVKLNIKGKNFLAVKTPDVEMELSPELLLIHENNLVNLDGKIDIERAQISLLDTFAGLAPSSDVVIIDPQAKIQEDPLVLSGKIRLKLSDRIYVQGAGFVGRITGELLIVEKPGDVTRATGELIIKDGRYSSPMKGDNIPGLLFSIAQKELIIDEGKLIFASSPIDNPRLDIRARRPTNSEIIVGVDIKGHVNNPQISLYSEPAMDQADILAYLTLGYPLTQASKNDGQYLARIASSIGLVGGEKLAKGIAKEFGIDEVYIQSEDTSRQAQLVLGKYLSPKLYIRYAVGIGDAVDTLQIQYKLTDRWIIRTESAVTKQGTDLIYTIEKD